MTIQLFDVEGSGIRFGTTETGIPYSVASDFAKTMGYRDAANVTRLLDSGEWGYQVVDLGSTHISSTPERRRMSVIYEDGMWELIFRSTLPGAKAIKKRVKEVLREIRETGSYSPSIRPALPTHSEALRGWADALDAQQAAEEAFKVADTERATAVAQNRALQAHKRELTTEVEQAAPKVASYEQLMEAEGTYSFAEAAKMLPMPLGQNRLYDLLRESGLILPGKREPYQEYVDRGYFELRAHTYMSNHGPVATATPRITPKGLEYIRRVVIGA